MRHLDAMRLHGMLVAVMIIADFGVIEVCHLGRKQLFRAKVLREVKVLLPALKAPARCWAVDPEARRAKRSDDTTAAA